MGQIEKLFLSEHNMAEISRKTGRPMEELRALLEHANANNKVQTFTIWYYEKRVGEE
jgi:hypothetical protein